MYGTPVRWDRDRAVRVLALVAAGGFLAVALGIRAVTGDHSGSGALAQNSGTALYASMVYAGVLLLWPRIAVLCAGLIAIAFCWAVELAQLTGIPAELSSRSIVARLVLGIRFDWTDMLWYPLGIIPLMMIEWMVGLRQRPRERLRNS